LVSIRSGRFFAAPALTRSVIADYARLARGAGAGGDHSRNTRLSLLFAVPLAPILLRWHEQQRKGTRVPFRRRQGVEWIPPYMALSPKNGHQADRLASPGIETYDTAMTRRQRFTSDMKQYFLVCDGWRRAEREDFRRARNVTA
jgi:hypothetical protein